MFGNLKTLIGEKAVLRDGPSGGGSTDAGDISYLMPSQHAYIGGAKGGAHSKDYELVDKELCYVTAAKALIATAIDLLADGAETGLEIKKGYKAPMTKDEYLTKWGQL
jgi:metal-dependent amidase/aminoacylase/carboxypeptidase family protein